MKNNGSYSSLLNNTKGSCVFSITVELRLVYMLIKLYANAVLIVINEVSVYLVN